jgi:hypothetical protein
VKGVPLMTAGIAGDALTARNATLQDAVALLRGQQARKIDVIAPAPAIRAEDGLLVLPGHVPAEDARVAPQTV